jgi:2-polyprenyl-3-methyl-5-hydroxy-6-metoxy-1,4-benzoquinol methylase
MIGGMDDGDDLRAMVTGFRVSAALSVAAELGVSDALAGEGCTVPELAAAVKADEDTLGRLLRALVAVGVYAVQDGVYSNTSMGERLRSDVPGTLRPLARMMQDPGFWSAWGHLAHSVRTGENAFEALHGVDVWAYRAERPEYNANFNANMTALSWYVGKSVAEAYDFAKLTKVVDVGGGQGILLDAVMNRHEHVQGVVFDLPHVVAKEPRSEALASRWSAAAGSFFESVPPADAYLIKSILHDWPDDRCVDILRTCAASLNPGGVVLVVELVLDRPGHEAEAAFSDLNMLVMPGGRERTQEDYATLFTTAGLHLNQVIDTGTRVSVLEATATP